MRKIIRITLLAVFAAGFAVFFSPLCIYAILNIGNFTGMLLFGAAFSAVMWREKLRPHIKRLWGKRAGKAAALALAAALVFGCVFACVTGAKIVRAAKNTPPEDAPLTVIVLGCRVYDSGPSLMLTARVNTAYDYLTAHPDAVCILSGGQGDDEPMTEAQCMYDMLTNRGVDPARLIKEEESTSTKENILFSAAIIEEENLPRSVAVVTNEYHQYRASLIAGSLGLTECYAVSAPSQRILLPTYFMRELFGVAYSSLTTH